MTEVCIDPILGLRGNWDFLRGIEMPRVGDGDRIILAVGAIGKYDKR
jgi:hypothetical protein